MFECEKTGNAFFDPEQGTLRSLDQVVADAEKTAIMRALQQTGGNRQKAAKLLDTALRNLYYKIKRYGI
jgi:DNA-binding NtrC family response regulator